MKINFNYLSLLGAVLAFSGNVFVSTLVTRCTVLVFSCVHVILAYVHRKDWGAQVGLYVGYQLLAIYGIVCGVKVISWVED